MKDGSVLVSGSLQPVSASADLQSLLAVRDTGVAVPLSRIHGASGRGAAWVRADSVLLAVKATDGLSARNVWRGTVRAIQDEADARLVSVDTEFGPVLSRITAEAANELRLAPGVEAWAIVKTHAL